MKPRIRLIVDHAEGHCTEVEIEGPKVSKAMLESAEDLVQTLTTGERPVLKHLYDLAACAFNTSRKEAKVRITAATYGMSSSRIEIEASRLMEVKQRDGIQQAAAIAAVKDDLTRAKDVGHLAIQDSVVHDIEAFESSEAAHGMSAQSEVTSVPKIESATCSIFNGVESEGRKTLRQLARRLQDEIPERWELQTSNSFRRVGTSRGDGSVLHATVQRYDGHPDLLGAPGVLDYIIAAQPRVVISLLGDLDAAEDKLRDLHVPGRR